MKLKAWLKLKPGRATALSAALGFESVSMVSQMASGLVRVPPDHYRAIRDFTDGEVGYEDLLPDAGQPARVPDQSLAG